jgi:serine/threonine protein kinase
VSLNHPHVGGIHGLEEAEGVRALVLELVEGPTLADRITHGPIPINEALPIARQIAEALEVAHEQGSSFMSQEGLKVGASMHSGRGKPSAIAMPRQKR